MASPNVFNQLARVKSVQDYDDEADAREVSRLGLEEKRRANAIAAAAFADQTADKASMQRFAQESRGDQNKLVQLLRNSGRMGLMTQADALEKSMLGRRETESKIAGQDATTGKTQFETQESKRKAAIQQIAALNSPEEAIGLLNQQVSAGAIPMQAAQALERMVRSDPKWQLRLIVGISDPKEMMAALQPHMQNAGGALVNTNPLAGPTGQGAPNAIPITQSADNAATQATSRANNAATVGASLANAAAVREAAKLQADATRAAASTKRDQDTEMKLADDYRTQSKGFKEAKDAYSQLSATLGSATTSPAATLAAATKFMKILDPGSVVRESELGMALAASGVIDRALNYFSTLQSGQKLTPTQAADFKKVSQQIYEAAQTVQRDIDKDYQAKAKGYGLRPEMVTQDLGQNAKVTSWNELK